jgi:hypothetical protein
MLLRPEHLSKKLDQPLPTKDGGTLRTILDARTYMLALSKQRDKAAMATGGRIAAWRGRRCRLQQAGRAGAIL